MSTLTTNRQYLDGDDLTQAQLDALADSIETWANGNVDASNLAVGGIGTTQLAAGAVTATKLASDAVTTAKILDGNVTGVKLDSGIVDNSTLAISSNQLIVKSGGVGTTQLADASVTQGKRTALGQQLSSSSSTFTHNTATITAVTNLSATITTTGRPVWVGLIDDANGSNLSELRNIAAAAGTIGQFYIYRDSTIITSTKLEASQGTTPMSMSVPVSSLHTLDVPSTGTYTYTVKVKVSTADGTVVRVYYAKLLAYEL